MQIEFVDEAAYSEAVSAYRQTSGLSLPLLQSSWWGSFKSYFGWNPLYCLADSYPILILRREVMLGREIWYIPWGPAFTADAAMNEAVPSSPGKTMRELGTSHFPAEGAFIVELARGIRLQARIHGIRPRPLCLRFDLPLPDSDQFAIPGLRRPRVEVQVPTTVLLDLRQDFAAITAGMKKKTRYNMRLAAKKGVTVRLSDRESLERDFTAWYAMYQETAVRDGIAIHSQEYYHTFLRLAAAVDSGARAGSDGEDAPQAGLLLAEHEGELLAGIVVAMYDGVAVYMYGASANHKRNLMPAYLLQAEAIQLAQAAACHSYDFLGIPASDNPVHPMHGLYRFKTGFGGRIVRRAGIIDLPVARFGYRVFRMAEILRGWYFYRLRKGLLSHFSAKARN